MTAEEVIETVAGMPSEEWFKIQSGIAKLVVARFSEEERNEIHCALAEAETELDRGEGLSGQEMRKHFGLHK